TLPGDVGEVWVRMFDRYRRNGDTTPTTVAIDHLCFQRVETSAMPPVLFFPSAPQMMLDAAQTRRPIDENLFSLLGQGDDDLRELLEDQDPNELEAFYHQWQAEDQDSIEFSEWLESQLEMAI
ncbi:MAG: hypothetical protein VX438_02525, partial [Planctomycetota bacterium]|nr:hypothetical protein [Planctomycetota bacterium]